MSKYMVEFNFKNGKAMEIKFFDHRWKAEKFAEENNGIVYEFTDCKKLN